MPRETWNGKTLYGTMSNWMIDWLLNKHMCPMCTHKNIKMDQGEDPDIPMKWWCIECGYCGASFEIKEYHDYVIAEIRAHGRIHRLRLKEDAAIQEAEYRQYIRMTKGLPEEDDVDESEEPEVEVAGFG